MFDFEFILTALFAYIMLFFVYKYFRTLNTKKKLMEVKKRLSSFDYTLSATRHILYKGEKVPVAYKTPQLFGAGFLTGKIKDIEILVTWSPFTPKSLLFIVIHKSFLDTHLILSSQNVKPKQLKRIQGKEIRIEDDVELSNFTIKAVEDEKIKTFLSNNTVRSVLKKLAKDFSIIIDDRSIEIECPKPKLDKSKELVEQLAELSILINNQFEEKA